MIRTGIDVMRERGMDPDGPWALHEFQDVGLEWVVFCNNCRGFVALPLAVIDADNRPWCEHCVTADQESEHQNVG